MTVTYECNRCHKVLTGHPGGANYQGDECPACEWDGLVYGIESEIECKLESIMQQQDELAALHRKLSAFGPRPT